MEEYSELKKCNISCCLYPLLPDIFEDQGGGISIGKAKNMKTMYHVIITRNNCCILPHYRRNWTSAHIFFLSSMCAEETLSSHGRRVQGELPHRRGSSAWFVQEEVPVLCSWRWVSGNRDTSSHASLPFPFVKFLSLLRYLSIEDDFLEGSEIALYFNQIIIIFCFFSVI